MLKAMREHAKFFYVLFFIVILSFIFWGVGTVDKSTGVSVAEVGKQKISVEEYWTAYDKAREFYRDLLKDKFTEETEKQLNLKRKVLDSLIEQKLLLAEAKREGITASDAEVEESIVNDPAFMSDGRFDRQVYLRRLDIERWTPQYYESLKRKDLALMKIRRLIEDSVDVSDVDVPLKGDEKAESSLRQAMLSQMRDAAVSSFVDMLRKQTRIKVNQQILS
jgi:hypothetical protein